MVQRKRTVNHKTNLVESGRVVFEICLRTDRQRSSQYFRSLPVLDAVQ